jgi:hypothetical protein
LCEREESEEHEFNRLTPDLMLCSLPERKIHGKRMICSSQDEKRMPTSSSAASEPEFMVDIIIFLAT